MAESSLSTTQNHKILLPKNASSLTITPVEQFPHLDIQRYPEQKSSHHIVIGVGNQEAVWRTEKEVLSPVILHLESACTVANANIPVRRTFKLVLGLALLDIYHNSGVSNLTIQKIFSSCLEIMKKEQWRIYEDKHTSSVAWKFLFKLISVTPCIPSNVVNVKNKKTFSGVISNGPYSGLYISHTFNYHSQEYDLAESIYHRSSGHYIIEQAPNDGKETFIWMWDQTRTLPQEFHARLSIMEHYKKYNHTKTKAITNKKSQEYDAPWNKKKTK
ncbi:ORF1 [Shuangao Bedbug Virus 2]|uniref:ORF1 n=1 Tax=Shuangao Bedbug Virus 2 TaxID=1608072 RepID=UPI0005AD22B6|nr:ORF1 [Shuangao Bedbug Virus 2]AJG39132.1 ORF1 [Shuangao Bedbug Virus 2]